MIFAVALVCLTGGTVIGTVLGVSLSNIRSEQRAIASKSSDNSGVECFHVWSSWENSAKSGYQERQCSMCQLRQQALIETVNRSSR